MDSIIGFHRKSKKNDSIIILVDRLSKVAHFIQVKTSNLASELAQIFVREIVRLHGT